jgi:hypothetical protein
MEDLVPASGTIGEGGKIALPQIPAGQLKRSPCRPVASRREFSARRNWCRAARASLGSGLEAVAGNRTLRLAFGWGNHRKELWIAMTTRPDLQLSPTPISIGDVVESGGPFILLALSAMVWGAVLAILT